jgi:hypothetical protein
MIRLARRADRECALRVGALSDFTGAARDLPLSRLPPASFAI